MTETPARVADTGEGGREPLTGASPTLADDVLDELMPDELDWRRLVGSYPIASVSAAALAGFLLGRSRGRELVSALSGFAADTFSESVNEFLGKDVL